MTRRVLIIDGHPDPSVERFGHTLAVKYASAAEQAGHSVKTLRLCELDFPWLRSAAEFAAKAPLVIAEQQERIAWAGHLVIIYPLWLGSMPAVLKAFFEQVMRPGFAFGKARGKGLPEKKLAGRSARIVVTMGMPAFFYQLYYRAHSLKSLERNILGFVGYKPIRATLIGNVEGMKPAARARCLAELAEHARLAR